MELGSEQGAYHSVPDVSAQMARDGFLKYEGDTFLVLAGKNASKKSGEDKSSESDLISNDRCKALIPIDNIPVIDHIILQHIALMDEFPIDRTLYIGAPEDLERKIDSYQEMDSRLQFVEQVNPLFPGSGRIANMWKGIDIVERKYACRPLDELYQHIMQHSTQDIYTEMSTRAKLVPVTIFSSIANKMVQKGLRSLSANDFYDTIRATIDHQLEEHMLPAWIQRCKIFDNQKYEIRLQRFKERIIKETIENSLIVGDRDGIRIKDEKLVKDLHNFHVNRNLGVYIISSDWPFQDNSMRWIINSVRDNKCPSLLMPVVDEKAIHPYHEIDSDYDGPIDFRNPDPKIRGWIEAPIEASMQIKYGNAIYIKPNRLFRAGLVENTFRQRKGNNSFVIASLLYHSSKYIGDIIGNREGSKGWTTGIEYPFCFNYKTLSMAARGITAYYISNYILNQEKIHNNDALSGFFRKIKQALTHRNTLEETNTQLSRILGCSFVLDPVPFGTAAIDLDRVRFDDKGKKYFPVEEYYGLWRQMEIPRAREYIQMPGNQGLGDRMQRYGLIK